MARVRQCRMSPADGGPVREHSAWGDIRHAERHGRMATTEAEVNQAHREKMARIKAAKDRLYASKTIEKGLLIVHTGTGKGKSTAAWGLAMRCLGHGRKLGVVQFVKGRRDTGERLCSSASPSRSRSRSWARASPGKPRTASATSPPRAPPGRRPSHAPGPGAAHGDPG